MMMTAVNNNNSLAAMVTIRGSHNFGHSYRMSMANALLQKTILFHRKEQMQRNAAQKPRLIPRVLRMSFIFIFVVTAHGCRTEADSLSANNNNSRWESNNICLSLRPIRIRRLHIPRSSTRDSTLGHSRKENTLVIVLGRKEENEKKRNCIVPAVIWRLSLDK